MRSTKDLQEEILHWKKENDVCILAHAYQSQNILEIADVTGDSYALSVQAAKAPQKTILMCGVRFMAETAKLLSPEKKVLLSHDGAGCPMAEQITPEELESLKKTYPGYAVVAYINTTARLKAHCDVCVTSSSAVSIIRRMENDRILFLPDCNLGAWVRSQVPEKTFAFVSGGCPVHQTLRAEDVRSARGAHPHAPVLVHPECPPEVAAMADFVGSTTEIMDFAAKDCAASFIIGTENSIVEHLQFLCPEKRFYPLSKDCVCHDMRLTTLQDVLDCVKGEGGTEIVLEPEVAAGAKRCIDAMLKLGG